MESGYEEHSLKGNIFIKRKRPIHCDCEQSAIDLIKTVKTPKGFYFEANKVNDIQTLASILLEKWVSNAF